MMKLRYVYYHLKAFLKRREAWVLVATIVLLIFVYKGITIPSIENTYIGIVTSGSERAENIVSRMEKKSTLYKVVRYDNDKLLQDDILNGKLECGFVFDDRFDYYVDKGKAKGMIEYYYSPYTTKGLVAKESLFAAYLEDYSDDILMNKYKSMFGSSPAELKEEIQSMLKERNAYYIDGNEIFEVDFK